MTGLVLNFSASTRWLLDNMQSMYFYWSCHCTNCRSANYHNFKTDSCIHFFRNGCVYRYKRSISVTSVGNLKWRPIKLSEVIRLKHRTEQPQRHKQEIALNFNADPVKKNARRACQNALATSLNNFPVTENRGRVVVVHRRLRNRAVVLRCWATYCRISSVRIFSLARVRRLNDKCCSVFVDGICSSIFGRDPPRLLVVNPLCTFGDVNLVAADFNIDLIAIRIFLLWKWTFVVGFPKDFWWRIGRMPWLCLDHLLVGMALIIQLVNESPTKS